ncbi:MAG: M28 family peptidase [Acidobacteriota bacterium]
MKKLLFAILMVPVLLCAAYAQNAGPQIATLEEITEDLKFAPCKNSERFEAVKKLFQKMGAAETDISSPENKGLRNIVLTKKGKSADTVVIGAHYDKVSEGCGVIDNWSGIVVLANIYRTFSTMDTEKTYVFAAFDKEELGLYGSAAMVKDIQKAARADYCSMVNLDSFGLGFPFILENASTASMVKAAKDLGTELKVPVKILSLDGAADADSSSFKNKDIPAITLSGLTENWPKYLHSSNDKQEFTNPQSVRVGYQFTLNYLVKIDAGACDMFRSK